MEYYYKGTPTAENVKHALNLYLSPVRKPKNIILGIWILTAISGTLFGIGGVILFSTGNTMYAFFFAFGILYIGFSIILFRKPKLDYSQIHLSRLPQEGVISEGEITYTSQLTNGKMKWEYLTGYGIGKELLVLFRGNVAILTLPKYFFDSEVNWNSVCNLVATKLEKEYDEINYSPPKNRLTTIISVFIIIIFMLIIIMSKK
jgi:hypothetical protein